MLFVMIRCVRMQATEDRSDICRDVVLPLGQPTWSPLACANPIKGVAEGNQCLAHRRKKVAGRGVEGAVLCSGVVNGLRVEYWCVWELDDALPAVDESHQHSPANPDGSGVWNLYEPVRDVARHCFSARGGEGVWDGWWKPDAVDLAQTCRTNWGQIRVKPNHLPRAARSMAVAPPLSALLKMFWYSSMYCSLLL